VTTRMWRATPVFAAAQTRADRGRGEIEWIGFRSAEVIAVDNALQAGGQPEDLVLGPPAALQALSPRGAGDGGVASPRDTFAHLLAGHGVAVSGDRAGDLRFDARVVPHPRATGDMAQVDIAVGHPRLAPDWLIESFAGWGATWHEALTQSIMRFQQGSLHPTIAGLLESTPTHDQPRPRGVPHPPPRGFGSPTSSATTRPRSRRGAGDLNRGPRHHNHQGGRSSNPTQSAGFQRGPVSFSSRCESNPPDSMTAGTDRSERLCFDRYRVSGVRMRPARHAGPRSPSRTALCGSLPVLGPCRG
jgi:hypothetical protein